MTHASASRQELARPDWNAIDTVLLDLDGTLLDQAYDNHIWRDLIPQRFAVARGLDLHAAYAEIARLFEGRSGTLDWYCIDYWTRTLGVDVAALHREVRSHVAWLPGAREFLVRMRASGKRLVLLTNSHPTALAVKHQQTGVLDHLDAAASSQEFGAPKEQPRFWEAARARFGYDPSRSLFADDNSRMLEAARHSGVRWVYGIRHWDTKGSRREHLEHPAVDSVLDLALDLAVPPPTSASYLPPRR
jgi:HAD superfamily hydrolase (TIGR01509 family)